MVRQLGLGLGDFGQGLIIAGLEVHQFITHRAKLGTCAGQRRLESGTAQAKQHLALAHLLVVLDIHRGHQPGNIGGHPDPVGLYIRTVGGDVTPARQVGPASTEQQHRQQQEHRGAALARTWSWRTLGGNRAGRGGGGGRRWRDGRAVSPNLGALKGCLTHVRHPRCRSARCRHAATAHACASASAAFVGFRFH
ncbi:hypothetical protein D3C85_756300 [compost metagenome]